MMTSSAVSDRIQAHTSPLRLLRVDTMSSGAVRYTPEYSFEDYELWEGDWELWDGVPVSMSPSPTPRHQLVSGNLFTALKTAVDQNVSCDCFVLYETDWRIGTNTVVRPDIAVLCDGLPNTFIDYAPSLIIEVLSPSTADKDRTAKRQLYQEQGVGVYLLADPDKNTIEGLQLQDSIYTGIPVENKSLSIEWKPGCRATIDVNNIFRDA